MRLSARDVYAHGLQLLDVFFFTKEELSHSLLFESKKKTDRTPLDQEKVYKLLGKVEKNIFVY